MTVHSDQLRTHYFGADSPNLDSAANVAEFAPGVPITVWEVGYIATTAVVHNSADGVITITRRPVAGSASNAVTLDTFTFVTNGQTVAAGKGKKSKVTANVAQATSLVDNSLIDESPTGAFQILPGESIALTVTVASASGVGQGWIRYSEGGLNGETEMVNYIA